jgi:spoIIIJ-associated protein
MDESTRPSSPPPAHAPEKVARAKAFCETLFRKLEVAVEVEGRETPETIQLAIKRPDGAEGELGSVLLEAVQYLVNRVVNPVAEGRKWVNLEVGGFREEGDPAVKAMALRLAEAAKRTGKILAVAPISARERRQIHLALVDEEGVSTRSEGEGIFRQLLIVPGPKPKGQRPPRPAGA